MTAILWTLLTGTVIAGTLLPAAAWFADRLMRYRSASERHILWTFTVIALLVFPCTVLSIQRVNTVTINDGVLAAAVPMTAQVPPLTDVAETSAQMPPLTEGTPTHPASGLLPSSPTIKLLIISIYLCGMLWFLAVFFTGHIRMFLRRSSARELPMLDELRRRFRIRRKIRVEWSENVPVPFTYRFFKPIIVLPAAAKDWSSETLRAVLLHELAHIVRRDLIWQNAAQLAAVFYWFHPLVIFAVRRIKTEQEFACDNIVLESGERSSDYAAVLLDLCKRIANPELTRFHQPIPEGGLAMLRKKTIVQRIDSVLNSTAKRQPASRFATCMLLAAAIIAVGAVSLLSPKIPLPLLAQTVQNAPEEPIQKPQENTSTFTCYIKDTNGKPVSGAAVIVGLEPKYDGANRENTQQSAAHPVFHLTSGSDGSFSFSVTAEQAKNPELMVYAAVTEHPDYLFNTFIYEKYTVFREQLTLPDHTKHCTINIKPAAKVTGTVLTPADKPAASVLVYASSVDEAHNNEQIYTQTGKDGKFSIKTLPGKERLLWILPDDAAPLPLELKENDADLGTLKLKDGIVVKGRAVDNAGKPAPDVWVSLLLKDSPGVRRHGHDAGCRAAVSDKNGNFQFHPVAPGDYTVVTGMLMEHSRYHPKSNPLPPQNDTVRFAGQDVIVPETGGVPNVTLQGSRTVTLEIKTDGNFFAQHENMQWLLAGRLNGKPWQTGFPVKHPHKFVIDAPAGLQKSYLMLWSDDEGQYYPLRYRIANQGALLNNWYAAFGNADSPLHVSAEPYEPGILTIECLAPNGKPMPHNFAVVKYKEADFEDPKTIKENGEVIRTGIERQYPALEFGVRDNLPSMRRFLRVLADTPFEVQAGGFNDNERFKAPPIEYTLKPGERRAVVLQTVPKEKKQ